MLRRLNKTLRIRKITILPINPKMRQSPRTKMIPQLQARHNPKIVLTSQTVQKPTNLLVYRRMLKLKMMIQSKSKIKTLNILTNTLLMINHVHLIVVLVRSVLLCVLLPISKDPRCLNNIPTTASRNTSV